MTTTAFSFSPECHTCFTVRLMAYSHCTAMGNNRSWSPSPSWTSMNLSAWYSTFSFSPCTSLIPVWCEYAVKVYPHLVAAAASPVMQCKNRPPPPPFSSVTIHLHCMAAADARCVYLLKQTSLPSIIQTENGTGFECKRTDYLFITTCF